ncbi:hypothetical protein ACLB1M_06520 [Escherichia coli]
MILVNVSLGVGEVPLNNWLAGGIPPLLGIEYSPESVSITGYGVSSYPV